MGGPVSLRWSFASRYRRPARTGAGRARHSDVPFRALNPEGQLITDLKAADVSLKIDNTPREIKSLDFVPLGKVDGRLPLWLPRACLRRSHPTWRRPGGPARRGLVLLVDEESDCAGQRADNPRGSGSHSDRASARRSPGGHELRQGGPKTGFTEDREQIKKALAGLGGYASARETPNDLRCRTLRLVQNVQAVFEAQTTGAAGTVALFSTSVWRRSSPGQTARIGQATGSDLCELRTEHFTQLASASTRRARNFYVVEVMDGSGRPVMQEAAGGLENLAGVTAGEIIRLSTNMEAQMGRLLRETVRILRRRLSTIPIAGSQNRRVDLSVTRGNVVVKAPQGIRRCARRSRQEGDVRDAEGHDQKPQRLRRFAASRRRLLVTQHRRQQNQDSRDVRAAGRRREAQRRDDRDVRQSRKAPGAVDRTRLRSELDNGHRGTAG